MKTSRASSRASRSGQSARPLVEDRNTARRLLEDRREIEAQIFEEPAANGKKRLLVRGEFARSGEATENKRIYSSKIWETQSARLEKALSERRVLGHLDHPDDGRTRLERVSHLITKLGLDENGVLIGEAEILDTARGRDLRAMLEQGVKIGVSSRGFGTTKPNDKGQEVVGEDYTLVTFDFVADPADQNAFPEPVFEGKEIEDPAPLLSASPASPEDQRLEEVRLMERERVTAELRGAFSKELLSKVSELRESVREEVRSELLSDPTVGGAKDALAKVRDLLLPYVLPEDAEVLLTDREQAFSRLREEHAAQLSEREAEIARLSSELLEAERLARQAGYLYFLERNLHDDPDAELTRRLIGDVMQYPNVDGLKGKLTAVREELAKKREAERKRFEERQRELDAERAVREEERKRFEEEVAVLKERQQKLTLALEKSLEVAKELKAENAQIRTSLYAEQRLANDPRAPAARAVIERVKPRTDSEVDEILEEVRPAPKDAHELNDVRARIARFHGAGRGPAALDEERAPQRTSERDRRLPAELNGIAGSLTELMKLSGMDTPGES